MNNKLYQAMIDFNKILLNFIVAYTFIGTFMIMVTKSHISALDILCLFPAPILSYLIYSYTKHKWSFVLFHGLLLPAYAFIAKSGFFCFVYCVYILILMVTKLAVKDYRNKNASVVMGIAFFVLIFYCSLYVEDARFNNFNFTLAIVYIILYLFNMYLLNSRNYFEIYPDGNNIAIKQIKYTNDKIMLAFVFICLLAMCVFSLIPLNEILSGIGSFLYRLIVKLLKKIFVFHSSNNASLLTDTGDASQVGKDLQYQTGSEDFFGRIMVALRIPVAFALAVFVIYKVLKLYHKKEENKINKTKSVPVHEKREKLEIKPVSINLKKIVKIFSPSNNGKIRKLYYQSIIKHTGSTKLAKDLTPAQLSKYALMSGDRTVTGPETEQKLTECYEKARYGKLECSNEEVQSVKELLK